MTVENQIPYQSNTANGGDTVYALSFYIEDKDNIEVTVNTAVQSKEYYSYDSLNNSVVFHTPLEVGSIVEIRRITPLEREIQYATYNNTFRPETLNHDLDRIWRKLQELGFTDEVLFNKLNRDINNLKNYVDDQDNDIKDTLLTEIQAQGVALDQLDNYYSYLLKRIAQIAIDKGWDASFVVDGEYTQKQINDKTIQTFESIADLIAIRKPKDGQTVFVKSYHKGLGLGGGTFIYNASKASIKDFVTIFDGWERQHNGALDVVDGGAIPDSELTQHTEIKRTFEACRWSRVLKFSFTKGTYLIGELGKNLGTLIEVWGVTGSDTHPQDGLEINGNGATIKIINGVEFGMFNNVNFTPYNNIINVTACKNIKITNLNIDGNKQGAVIGGKYGDHGWQIPCYGIRLISAKKAVLENINVKNMLLDGLYIGKLVGADQSKDDITLQNVHSTYNGRQAFSVCGVRGLTAINCSFNYTGQNGLMSAPSAGIDFENELGSLSDLTFINCEVRGNVGHDLHIFNLQSDFDIRNVNFYSSTIVAEGKTAYPFGTYDPNENKSAAISFNISIDFRFHDCLIGGKVMRENGGTNWQYEQTKMVSFNNCTFTNDELILLRTLEVPKYSQIINTTSPDGTEYGLKLDNCRFKLKDQGIKMLRNGRIHNCIFEMSFTKKLAGHAIDFGTCSLYQNVFYTFDNIEFSNTVNFALWDNTTNRLDSNDAPEALIWAKILTTGQSGDISTTQVEYLTSTSNINDAYTNNDRIFEKRYILQGVKISDTYPEVWGTAIFTHALGGDGALTIYATNYNGITANRRRATSVWGDFKITN